MQSRLDHRGGVRDDKGLSTVEMAFVLPLYLFIVMCSVQFAIFLMQDLGVKMATDSTARWLAITHLKSNLPPGVLAGNFTTITISPTCTSLNSAGQCVNRNPGGVLSIQVTYDLTSSLLLPRTFGFGSMQATLPTTLPLYQV